MPPCAGVSASSGTAFQPSMLMSRAGGGPPAAKREASCAGPGADRGGHAKTRPCHAMEVRRRPHLCPTHDQPGHHFDRHIGYHAPTPPGPRAPVHAALATPRCWPPCPYHPPTGRQPLPLTAWWTAPQRAGRRCPVTHGVTIIQRRSCCSVNTKKQRYIDVFTMQPVYRDVRYRTRGLLMRQNYMNYIVMLGPPNTYGVAVGFPRKF